jgi:receptor-type tyrosine-protein phosphatase gamma
MRIFLI